MSWCCLPQRQGIELERVGPIVRCKHCKAHWGPTADVAKLQNLRIAADLTLAGLDSVLERLKRTGDLDGTTLRGARGTLAEALDRFLADTIPGE